MSLNQTLTETEVVASEAEKLAERRKNAGLDVATPRRQPGADPSAEKPAPPVGLAISGGGIRSASMALGLLQSFYRRGVLRQIDYLSTVSGGSYAGSMLSSQIATSEGDVDWTPADDERSPNATRLPIYAERGAAQPKSIQLMAFAGENLKRPLRFLSRHLWGLITVNTWVFSGLIALSALAAYLFRFFDTPVAIQYVSELGFHTDLARAYFPATIAFLLWLITAAIAGIFSRRFEKFPQISTYAYTLLLLTLAMGTVSLFSTGNLDLKFLEETTGLDSTFGDRVRAGLQWAGQALMVVFMFAVAPYLNMKALVRSGTQPRNRVEGWVFNLASTTLLLGAPLGLFYFLSSENISNHNKSREFPHSFSTGHVRDWKRLLQELRLSRIARLGLQDSNLSPAAGEPGNRDNTTTAPARPGMADIKRNASDEILHALGTIDPERAFLWKRFDEGRSEPAQGAQPLPSDPKPSDTPGTDEEAWTEQTNRGEARIEWINNSGDKLVAAQNQLHFFEPVLDFLGSLVQNTDFTVRLQSSRLLSEQTASLVDDLNWEILADPDFFEHLLTDRDARHSSTGKGPLPQNPSKPNLKHALRLGDGVSQDAKVSNFVPDRELDDSLLEPGRREAVLAKLLQHAEATREAVKSTLTAVGVTSAAKQEGSDEQPETLWEQLRKAYNHQKRLVEVEQFDGKEAELAIKNRDLLREQISHVQLANWNILRVLYGKENFFAPKEVFAKVVSLADQGVRARILLVSALTFLLLGICVAVNPTMMHGFYRDQLASIWIRPVPIFGRAIPLRLLDTVAKGGPLHLINATLNLSGAEGVGGQMCAERFVFSQLHIGSRRTGFQSSRDYEDGECKLDDVTAISGAAISPVATENVIVRLLLILFNCRLGQWLPNPRKKLWSKAWATPLRLLTEYLMLPPENRSYLFVSDGGHHENTGIESLLERRCRLIIAADFSQDEDLTFSDFRRLLLRTASADGVHLVPGSGRPEDDPLLDLVPDKETRFAKSHCALYRIEYPRGSGQLPGSETQSGWLILIKPGFTGDEPTGLRESRRDYGAFPHDSTVDQLFESIRFMAYRQLGEHLGDTVCDEFFGESLQQCESDPQQANRLWLAKDWNPPRRHCTDQSTLVQNYPQPELPAVKDDRPDTDSQQFLDELRFLEDLTRTGLDAERAAHICELLTGPSQECRELATRCLWESGGRGGMAYRRKIAETIIEVLKAKERFAHTANPACQRIDLLKALDTISHKSMTFIPEYFRQLQNDRDESMAVRQYCGRLLERNSKKTPETQ